MNNFSRICFMTVIGFFIVLIAYPFLHESGHYAAIKLCGGECLEFNIFPTPYVLCDVTELSDFHVIIIGLSGYILPFLVSFIIPGNFFYIWYARLILRSITVFSFIASGVVVILRRGGTIIQNEDITQVLDLWIDGERWVLPGILVLIVFMLLVIMSERPLARINTALG